MFRLASKDVNKVIDSCLITLYKIVAWKDGS